PAQVEGTRSNMLATIGRRQESLANVDRVRDIDAQPTNLAIVDALELGLETAAELDDGSPRMRAQPRTQRIVEDPRAKWMCGVRLAPLAHIVVRDRVVDPHRLWIDEKRIGPLCLARAIVERPQHRLGNTVECDGHRAAPGSRTACATR